MNTFSALPEGRLIHQEHELADPCGDICRVICEDVAYSEFESCLTVGLKELLEVAHLFRIVGRLAIVRSATSSSNPRQASPAFVLYDQFASAISWAEIIVPRTALVFRDALASRSAQMTIKTS